MNSIIDQYENEKSIHQSNTKGRTVSVAELASQYALLNFEFDPEKEDTPMFNISRLKSLPPITSRLQHFAVGGEHLVFVAVNNTLTFLNWKDSSKPKEIDINKTLGFANKVNGVFLDPIGGHHILLSVTAVSNVNSSPASATSSDYLFYCNTSLSHLKLRPVEKMRNHNVTAVAWNRMIVTPQCTGPILLGTSKGLIFEIKLNAESDKLFQSSIDSYCKDVFDIGRGIPAASITGLEFFKFSNAVDKYFVIATTVNRLYQFIGSVSNVEDRPSLAQIFDDYLKIPEGFVELPNTPSVSYSQVHFTKTEDETGRFSLVPKSFGWHVNKIGIVYRQIQSEWRKGMTEVCVLNSVLDYSPLEPAAITFLLTEFHFLLLYPDRIEIFSVLNKENCFVESHNTSHGKFLDLCKDIDDNVWVLAERAIYKCRFIKEDRSVWRIYLDMKKFSLAKEHCKTNINRLYKVMKKEAEYYFENGQYEESASLYSQLDGISFEEISLKFLLAGQIEALKLYLMKMLEKLKPYENAHITMITFWLFEIYEKQFADAKYGNYPLSEQKQLQRDFKTLLSLPHVQNCVVKNREVTYKLLNSHGDTENLIHVALMLRDYEKVVRQYLEEGRVNEAVNILKDESAPIQKDLISSFMTTFISMAPKDTVDVLIKLARNLQPCSILPSLIFPYDNEVQAAEVIRFLEYCTHSLHSHDQAIHNYLITLYAKYKPDRLMRYLASQGHDETEINYDIRYALKLCQEYGLTEACVQLSALLGLWESAVDLALSIDVELAKQTVPQLNSENAGLCKKLWLKIAQHVVQKSKDIKEAMKFVQQCDIVRIEDILPFFDDFVTIDHFRDAICTSIQEYNQNIEELKGEMDDATKSADEIRNDLSSFKCRYDTIQSSMLCTSCNIQLLIRPFYIFPCSHRFHIDCLVSELRPHLSEINVKKVDTLQRQLAEMSQNPNVEDRNPTSLNSRNLKDQIKSELDSILASECFFCGSIAIEQIDTPFIEDDEFERIRVDWE